MLKIKFYEVFKEEKIFLQKYIPKSWQVILTPQTIQESDDKNIPGSMICIRTQSIVPVSWSSQLKGILTRSQGFDHLQKYIQQTKTKAACGYLPEYSALSVAEHVLTVTLMLLKKIQQQKQKMHQFNRDDLTGLEITHRRVLVLGVGQIGSHVIELFTALDAEVKGVDIDKRFKNVKYISLAQGLLWADVVVCALPLTSATENLLNAAKLSKLKRGSLFINIGRGEISPLKDLAKLLKYKTLSGLALDVYPQEGILAKDLRTNINKHSNHSLIRKWFNDERVILTPHNAFNTREAVERKSRLTVESWQSLLTRGTFPRVIV